MASLADSPNLVGFFSYSREDDDDSGGRLSKLRERIQAELRGQLGRTKVDFRLWQDKTAIAHGKLWEDEIKSAIAESVFFIPIITPTAVRSHHCKFEFDSFLAREKELGRRDLVFPILYIPVPALTGDRWRQDPLLAIIGSRQYEQWQSLRHLDASSTEVGQRVEIFCANICRALQQEWLSPEERQQAEARRAAEDERRREEKLQEAARRVADEERRRQEAENKRRFDEAEAEKRQRDDEEGRRREAEKKRPLVERDAVSVPKSTGRPALFTRGPVIGSIAAAVAAVFLLTYLIWSRSQQLAPTISDPASVQPSALANTSKPDLAPPAASSVPVQQAAPPALNQAAPPVLNQAARPAVETQQPPIVLVTSKKLPVNNLKDLIALVKANPGKYNYGSTPATPRACAQLDQLIGDVVNVPYRGTGPALQDLAAGQISYMCDVVSTVKRQIDSGAVKAIAILNKERSKELPNVSTALEQGIPIP
jgi:hypothetical protein